MEELLFPFTKSQQAICFLFLLLEREDEEDAHFISTSFNSVFETHFSAEFVNPMAQKFQNILKEDLKSIRTSYKKIKLLISQKPKTLTPPIKNCLYCNSTLVNAKLKNITTYHYNGPESNQIRFRRCNLCDTDYGLSSYVKRKKNESDSFYIYPNKISTEYLQISNETCFELKLLRNLDEQIFRSGVTFEMFSISYNSLFENYAAKRPLCRKRLSEAWFTFKIKHFLLKYSGNQEIYDFSSKETEIYLENKLEYFKRSFLFSWSKIHDSHCRIPNCNDSCMYFIKTNII